MSPLKGEVQSSGVACPFCGQSAAGVCLCEMIGGAAWRQPDQGRLIEPGW